MKAWSNKGHFSIKARNSCNTSYKTTNLNLEPKTDPHSTKRKRKLNDNKLLDQFCHSLRYDVHETS